MDYGLLGGIGEGFKQAISSYMTQTQRQQDWARQQKQDARDEQDSQLKRQAFESGLLEKGLLKDSNGNIVKNDQMQLKDKLESDDLQRQQAEATPGTPESEKAIEQAKAAYNAAQPGLGDKLATGWQTGKDARNSIYGKEIISGGFGVQKEAMKGQRANDRNSTAQSNLDERKNQNAAKAGQAFESDALIKKGKTTLNSLDRAMSLLNSDKPLTSQQFNIAQNDFINAMTADGSATEGKINREMVTTLAGEFNQLASKIGKVKDVRKELPELIQNIKDHIGEVHKDYENAIGNQALDIHDSYKFNTNDRVQATIKDKLKRYAPAQYEKYYGKDERAPQSQASTAPPSKGLMGGNQGLLRAGMVRIAKGSEMYDIAKDSPEYKQAIAEGFKEVQ